LPGQHGDSLVLPMSICNEMRKQRLHIVEFKAAMEGKVMKPGNQARIWQEMGENVEASCKSQPTAGNIASS